MEKCYEKPALSVRYFSAADIITTSSRPIPEAYDTTVAHEVPVLYD